MNKEYLEKISIIRNKIRSGIYVNLCGNDITTSSMNGEPCYEPFVQWISDNYNFDPRPDQPYFQTSIDTKSLSRLGYRYYCACKAIWGEWVINFDDKTPEQIEQFLSLYYDTRIVLTAVEKTYNGNPSWTFHFQQAKEKLEYLMDDDRNFSLLSLDPRLFASFRL